MSMSIEYVNLNFPIKKEESSENQFELTCVVHYDEGYYEAPNREEGVW